MSGLGISGDWVLPVYGRRMAYGSAFRHEEFRRLAAN